MQWHKCWCSSAVSRSEAETETEGTAMSADVVTIIGELGRASWYMATPMGLTRRLGRPRVMGGSGVQSRDRHHALSSGICP